MNSNQVNDPEMDRLTVAMRSLEPTQKEEYSKIWLEFQKYYADYLPTVPLYSNQYFDIHSKYVHGMDTTPFADWTDIICNLYKK
jgi:peptide/nickel transport system substrate-binding protein